MSRESLERAALAAELSGDSAAAVAARRGVVLLEPRCPHARLALARSLQGAQLWREAVQAFVEALQRGADTGETQRALGNLLLRHKQHARALQHFRKSLAAAPDHPDTLFRTGLAMHRLRRFRDAVGFLERALEFLPDTPELHFSLGLARFESGDLDGALASLDASRTLKRGRAWTADPVGPLSREPDPAYDGAELYVNEVKLRHDLEQIDYLLDRHCLPESWRSVAGEYRALLQEVRGVTGGGIVVPFDVHRYPLVARTYKRPFHVADAVPRIPVLNPRMDAKGVENAYLKSAPNMVVVDDLLGADSLGELRRYCRENTVWNNVQSGYLGAYCFDGFASMLLLRVAKELRDRLPRIIPGLPLQMLWGYKYDHQLQGIGVHADAAAVNINFWITEDDANLEPEGGGLLVYPHAAPADWAFDRFNRDPAEIMRFLESVRSEPVRIPHRANRAVIFDSDLFHATDRLNFREGYANRRVNITLLYGMRAGN